MSSHKHRVSRAMTLCALCLFLVSMLLPFLTIKYYSIIEEEEYYVTYWSFKVTNVYAELGREFKNETLVFLDYWFAPQRGYSPPSPYHMGVSWIIVAIFVAQVFTLLLGASSFLVERNWLRILPLFSALSVIFLMASMWLGIQRHTYFLSTYSLGYWLVWLSTFLYGLDFVFGLVIKRK